jgi:site-specific DNA-methyltransferase (cytosine-N4-specific)
VVTSPPYALHFKKEYGNRDKHAYVDWFLPFGTEIFRVLAPERFWYNPAKMPMPAEWVTVPAFASRTPWTMSGGSQKLPGGKPTTANEQEHDAYNQDRE